jgi:rRNA-processing protein FCF1
MELAQREACPLATLDSELTQAALAQGIQVLE